MTNNPQILGEDRSPMEGGHSHYESETPPTPDALENSGTHEDTKETPRSSSLFRHSCTRRFWIVLVLLVVVVIGLSSLGAHIIQMNKRSDNQRSSTQKQNQRPITHKQVGSDLNGEAAGDGFGGSVALSSDGTRLAIGAPGNGDGASHVRVYEWTGSQWTQLGSDFDGEAAGDQFGLSVALSSDGTRVAVGAPYNDDNGDRAGHVRVYDWTGSQWAQVGSDLDGEAERDWFGYSVALSSDGSRLAIGAHGNDGNDGNDYNVGHVRVYDWTGSQWTQVGSDLNGVAAGKGFGYSVALSSDGTRVAIGAPAAFGGNGNGAGHVRVYDWTGSQWTQVGSDLDGEAAYDLFGRSVALSSDGTRVAIGAPDNYGAGERDAGHVRVYDWTESQWTQVGSDLDGEASSDNFGYSVALSSDGTRLAIGAPKNDSNGDGAGHVRVYDWTGSQWTQVGSDLDGEAERDEFGFSVALSSDGARVAIGARYNDGNGHGAGHVRVYEVTS